MINYPIYLTNLNRLTSTRNMVNDLFKLNRNSNINIIDNASTYPPLLKWYNEIKNDVNIIKNDLNHGPWVFFYGGIFNTCKDDYYIYSDADLELNPNMPYNWQEIMIENLHKYKRKSSLALKLSDVPEGELKNIIIQHQSICWDKTDQVNAYQAVTDMTFTLDAKINGYRYESIRLAGDFECRHLPWYLDFKNLSEEEIYYINHIDDKFNDACWSRINKETYLKNK
jgi:hypothetical protein